MKTKEIEKELQKGADKARAIAQNVLHRVRDKLILLTIKLFSC